MKGTQRPKKKRNQSKNQTARSNSLAIPRAPRESFPRYTTLKLTFSTTAAFVTLTPGLVIVTNTVHNCFGTGVVSTPNKNQIFRQFYAFKVIAYRLKVELQNTGADPIYGYFLHANVDPTTLVTNYPVLSNNPMCSRHLIGAATSGASSRYTHRARHTIAQVNGNPFAVQADDTWSGAGAGLGVSTADPVDKTYCGIGFISAVGGGAIAVAGLVEIEYETVFWDRVLTVV